MLHWRGAWYASREGISVSDAFASVPDTTFVPVPLGGPFGGLPRTMQARAVLGNARAVGGVWRLARLCRRQRIDVVHVTDRPRDAPEDLRRNACGRRLLHHRSAQVCSDPRLLQHVDRASMLLAIWSAFAKTHGNSFLSDGHVGYSRVRASRRGGRRRAAEVEKTQCQARRQEALRSDC